MSGTSSTSACSSEAAKFHPSPGADSVGATTIVWPERRCAAASVDTTVSSPPMGAGASRCRIVSGEVRALESAEVTRVVEQSGYREAARNLAGALLRLSAWLLLDVAILL